MKTILVVFDGRNISQGALEFAKFLNELEHSQIVCVVLSSLHRSLLEADSYDTGEQMSDLIEIESEEIDANIQRFRDTCEKNNFICRLHNDSGAEDPLDALIKETRFADVLIIGSEVFYRETGTKELNPNLKEILHKAECPAILVPEHVNFPRNIVLTYDGSSSSVYAIKLFAYLFPMLKNLPAYLVYTSKHNDDIPDRRFAEEELALHFADLTIQKLELDPRQFFDVWLKRVKNPLVVAGAFGRSRISELFEKNFLPIALSEHKHPLFIAHPHK